MRIVYIEVSNTLSLSVTTGIQRVTRELLRSVTQISTQFHFIPIIYCPYCATWRILTEQETSSLFQENDALTSKKGTVFGDQVSLGVKTPPFLRKNILLRWLWGQYKKIRHVPCPSSLHIRQFQENSIFLDIESSWFSPVNRKALLPRLHQSHVQVAIIHYDIVPLLYPQYTHPVTKELFTQHFDAHVCNSSFFLCISENSRRDLSKYVVEHYENSHLETALITLGSNFSTTQRGSLGDVPQSLLAKRYILTVGTIEPRKNYDRLLTAFETVEKEETDLALVIVGKKGWHASSLISRLKSHPLFNIKIFWLFKIDDQELTSLYKNAYLGIIPSLYEGYGLPLVEMLQHGCVTLASNTGSLPEVGGKFVEYFDPNNYQEISNIILRYCTDEELYKKAKKQIAEYIAPTWKSTGKQLITILDKHI